MKGLAVGQQASLTRTFSAEDVAAYRTLTGDTGLGFAAAAEQTVVPGPLLGGLFSTLLGTRLPGRGTGWLKQHFDFMQPAFVGEALTATVAITRLRPEKALVNLRTECRNPAGEIVCVGEALVLVADLAAAPGDVDAQ